MRKILSTFCTTVAILVSVANSLAAVTPNIIVIMGDDVGFGDVGCYGADTNVVATPNIDRLANEGRRFTSGYSANSTCTPSRYAFLTGQYAWRKSGTGIGGPNSTLKIDVDRLTIADVLKAAGYSTAVIGKWHLGLGSGSPNWNGQLNPGPLELGFDYCFLLPNTNDRVPSVYVENHEVVGLDPADPLTVSTSQIPNSNPYNSVDTSTLVYTSTSGHKGTVYNNVGRIGYMSGGHAARFRDEDMADDFVYKATSWIEANTNQPFFLYFASQDNHVPRLPHERFQGQSALGWRGDALVQLDWCVGELINTVETLGISSNTLFVFCSDNGPVLDDGYNDGSPSLNTAANHSPSGGFRGNNNNDWKYSVYEGGTRTPFITWWPGRIDPGMVSDEIVCSIDLAASFAELTGQNITNSGALPDSFNLLDELLGENGSKGRNHLIQANNNGSSFGYRANNWKLAKGSQLYNLDTDPGEQTNLAGSSPDKLAEMQAWLAALQTMDGTAGISLIASAGYGTVLLDWIDGGTTNVDSYSILRGTSASGPYTTIATGVVESAYTDYPETNGIPYYYVATTLFNDGTAPFDSNEASATPAELPSNATNLFMEAEDSISFSGNIASKGTNWSGSGYVDLDEGGHIDFVFHSPIARKFDLELQTAGDADNMALEVSINGNIINPAMAITNTTSWNASWAVTTETNVLLDAGSNTIRFRDNGSNQPQIDHLLLTQLPDAFDTWTNDYTLEGGPYANADGDDLNNVYEYGLGGNPTNAFDAGHLPQAFQTLDSGSNWFIYVHPRRSDPFSGITYTLEQCDNLTSNVWNPTGFEMIGIQTNGFEPGFDAVTNRILIDTQRQQFMRLIIERP